MPTNEGIEGDRPNSCSSSIGRNSDCSHASGGSDGDDSEVQSELKGPLDTMDVLEDCLPIKRSISKFYCGKSKSFTSLIDAPSASAQELAKPENCTRKRKNLLACSKDWDSEYSNLVPTTGDNLCKRLMTTNQSMSALSHTQSSSDSSSNSSSEEEQKNSPLLPPRHPCGKALFHFPSARPQKGALSVRSFSFTDLQGAR